MSQSKIPMVDVPGEIEALWSEFSAAIEGVLRSGRFIMGPEVTAFETEFASYLGLPHAIAVNSGSDALVIGLQALGVGPGDEVITTPFTFVATGSAILRVGATPVFADIDPRTFNLDPSSVQEVISDRTKAVIPVHLFGLAADMDALMELSRAHGLVILEDVAQALSGRHRDQLLGTFGSLGAYSFFPSKNLGAFGDGGMITCSDDAVAEHARMLRSHGSKTKYRNEILGYNSRLDALQAAILRVKLPALDESTRGRQRAAQRYDEALAGHEYITLPTRPAHASHSYHQYTLRVPAKHRDGIREHLSGAGVSSMIYYPVPLPDLPLFREHPAEIPRARLAATEVLSLPIWPSIASNTQDRVVQALLDACQAELR